MRSSITRLIGLVVSLNPRRWSTDARGASLGMVCVGIIVTALVVFGHHMIHGLADHPFMSIALLITLMFTQRYPIEMRRGTVTVEILLDAGLLVLALALFGPMGAVAVWLLFVLYFELAHRDFLAIACTNTAIALAAAGAAAWVQHALNGTAWATHGPVGAALQGTLVGLTYTFVEGLVTELASRILMDRAGEPVDWRPVLAAVGAGGLLGGAAGFTLALTDPVSAMGLLVIPLALASWTGQMVSDHTRSKQLTRILIAGMTRLASADRLDEVREIVEATAPGLASYTAVTVTDQPPDGTPRVVWLPLVEEGEATGGPGHLHGTDSVEAPTPRWLRANVINYHTAIPAEQRDLLEALAATARAATTRILERERTSHALRHDALTGLLNRNGLWEVTRTRHPSGASLLLIDLDGFKAVNDVHGHDTGDRVLLAVSRSLAAVTPADASVARWGGDEFVVQLARELSEDDLNALGHRIIAAIEIAAAGVCPEQDVSASIGYARAAASGEHLDTLELFHRADQAMYDAKWAGKGTVRGFRERRVHPFGHGAT